LFLNCPHISLIKRIRILNYAIPFRCTCILQIGRTHYMYMYVHFKYKKNPPWTFTGYKWWTEWNLKEQLLCLPTMSSIVRSYGTAGTIIPCIYVLFQPIVTAPEFLNDLYESSQQSGRKPLKGSTPKRKRLLSPGTPSSILGSYDTVVVKFKTIEKKKLSW
jgi:hypothetical protein